MAAVYRETAQQGCGQKGISRQLPCRWLGEFCETDRRRRERVIARDRAIGEGEHERSGNVLPCVLPCLHPQIPVEWFGTAFEGSPVVSCTERFDAKIVSRARHVSVAGLLAIAVDCVAQAIVDGCGLRSASTKAALSLTERSDADAPRWSACCFLNAREDKIRDGPALEAAARSMRFFWSSVMRVSRRALRTRPGTTMLRIEP